MNVPSRLPGKDKGTMTLKLKYGISLLAWGLSVLVCSSCQEELRGDENESGNRISFDVRSDTEFLTKINDSTYSSDLDICGEALCMTMTMSDNADSLGAEGLQTRGAAFDNSQNLITKMRVTSIVTEGNGGKSYFTEEVDLDDSGHGISGRFWTEAPLSFFAYAVSKNNVTVTPAFKRENNQCKGTFSYTMPEPATADPKKDATAQPDVVFAITPDLTRTADGSVDLEFHHALSALVFKVGKMPANVYLNSVSIRNVYSSGSCTITPSADKDLAFSWSYSGSQNTSYTEYIGTNAVADSQMGGEEAVFMMIPQTMGADTKLVLSFSIGGREYSLVKPFNEIISRWEADKKYTFKISVPSQIDVEVEDAVVGIVKKDVKIQNTGTMTGYIRAAIVGYWVNAKGDIVAPWKDTDGVFDWGTQWSSRWKLGSDGFYYHLVPVAASAYTYPLFESYTLSESSQLGSPNAFYTLELSIITQIIRDDDKHLWPELN